MKQYKLLKPFLDYKVGHVFEGFSGKDSTIVYPKSTFNGHTFVHIEPHEIELLKATGFLEEVVERKDKDDVDTKIDNAIEDWIELYLQDVPYSKDSIVALRIAIKSLLAKREL